MRGWALAWALLWGCEASGHAVVVDVRTDLSPGIEFDGVRVRLDGRPAGETLVTPGADYARGVRAAELADVASGPHELEVELVRDGSVELARVVLVQVRAATSATITLTRDCRGVACPLASDAPSLLACVGGRCVDPSCTDETPELCAPECAADTDCTPPVVPCLAPRCAAGACLDVDDGSCGAGRYCDAARGCQPIGGPSDAGVDAGTDAGAPDAGLAALDDEFEGGLGPGWTWIDEPGVSHGVIDGELTMAPTDNDWWYGEERASLLHRAVPGDFVVTTSARTIRRSGGALAADQLSLAGLVVRDPASAGPTERYVAIFVGVDAFMRLVIENKETVGGVTAPLDFREHGASFYDWALHAAELRICRLGDRFLMLARAPGGTTWNAMMEHTIAGFPAEAQVGLTAESRLPVPPDAAGVFEWIRFRPIASEADCLAP